MDEAPTEGGTPPPPPSAGEVVQQIRALVAGLGDRQLGDDELEALTTTLEAARRAIDAGSAHVVGELDARGATDRRHGHATRTWIGATHQLPSAEGSRRVRVARLLRCCPVLATALADGQISFDHAVVIANATNVRNIDVVVQLQQHLIDLTTEYVLFRAWAAHVADMLRLADEDGPEPRPEHNSLHLGGQFDGSARLTGTLVGETRHVVDHVLNQLADQLFHRFAEDAAQAPDDCEIPHRSALLALALAEACRMAAAAGHKGAGTAADVTYVVHSDDPGTVRTPDGERVDHHTASVACCDGAFHAVVMDRFGAPLDVGRTARFANRDQRRAAHARDGGCTFPGCGAPASHTDLHHVQHWAKDGPSDMINFACLCRHHHGVVHRRGWSMRAIDHQWFEIITPSGAVLGSQRHGRTLAAAA
jgi:hypothetical protein